MQVYTCYMGVSTSFIAKKCSNVFHIFNKELTTSLMYNCFLPLNEFFHMTQNRLLDHFILHEIKLCRIFTEE